MGWMVSGLDCRVEMMSDKDFEMMELVFSSAGDLLASSWMFFTLEWKAVMASPLVLLMALTTSRDITEEVPSQIGRT